MDEQKEPIAHVHFRAIRFMNISAIKLRMKSVTFATSAAIYHAFFKECSTEDYDIYLIATTALYLAGKVEEDHMKLRDVINVCYRTLHPNEAGLEIGEKYWVLRDLVVHCELFLMRMLKFHVRFDHPHKYLLHYVKSLSDWFEPSISKKIPFGKFAWAVLRDSYHGNICLRFRPEHIAIAIIHFILQIYGLEVPYNHDGEYKWWEVFSEDITTKEIKNIAEHILDIYVTEQAIAV